MKQPQSYIIHVCSDCGVQNAPHEPKCPQRRAKFFQTKPVEVMPVDHDTCAVLKRAESYFVREIQRAKQNFGYEHGQIIHLSGFDVPDADYKIIDIDHATGALTLERIYDAYIHDAVDHVVDQPAWDTKMKELGA